MVLAGCVIDDLVVGGPAALSQKIQKGDKILKVDEVPVSLDTVRFFSRDSSFAMGRVTDGSNRCQVTTAVIGCDKPGSTVTLELAKNGVCSPFPCHLLRVLP